MHIFTGKSTISVLDGGNMQNMPVDIPDSLWLQNYFADYANPRAKAASLVRRGELYRLKRGLYIRAEGARDAFIQGRAANRIYGPSYVSFVYSLSWYGLIPERASHITSATFGKGRKKRYDTPAGSFFYQDVPSAAYPYGITFIGEPNNRFLMACPEKALCDELYRISGIRSIQGIEALLFEDLRLDPEAFGKLDRNSLIRFSSCYHAVTLKAFVRLLERGHDA